VVDESGLHQGTYIPTIEDWWRPTPVINCYYLHSVKRGADCPVVAGFPVSYEPGEAFDTFFTLPLLLAQ
jgi:hypothetical protein